MCNNTIRISYVYYTVLLCLKDNYFSYENGSCWI